MSTPRFGRQPGSLRRSGFTLIEVAIALAIFVFGALAIVQIFPPALGVIRNNESRITATQLGQTTLARTAGKPDSVPDAIYESDATGQWLSTSDIPQAVVGTSSKNNSLPNSPLPADFDNSSLNHFKYVRGEKHVVRDANGIPFVMLNHPYSGAVAIYRTGEVEGVQISSKGKLDFQYATNSDGTPYTPSIAPTYYVSYHWKEGSNIHGVIDEPQKLLLATDNNDLKVAQGLIDSSDHILPGGVSVNYRVATSYSPVAGTTDNAARGYLPLTGATVGETLSFDYLVADWRNIVDENRPDKTGTISLPIQNLDQSILPQALLTYNIGSTQFTAPLTPTSASDYKQGQLNYNLTTLPAGVSNQRIRTIYRGIDSWTQQLSVAAKSYIPFYTDADFAAATPPNIRPTNTLPREQWREYYWDSATAAEKGNVYFHASEAGKSVLVSFVDDTTGKAVTVNLIIGDRIIPTSPNPSFSNGPVSVARILNPAGIEVAARSILSVQGLSVQARTAWLNADKYNQVIVPGYRNLLQ